MNVHLPDTPVCLIVPCTWHPELAAVLSALLQQKLDGVHCIFVTETRSERAAHIIRELQQSFPNCIHVVAGSSRQCGQKNWNLLAGIARARPLRPKIVLCCDDDCYPSSQDWLTRFLCGCASHPGFACYTAFRVGALHSPVSLAQVLYYSATKFQHIGIRIWPTAVWGGAMAFSLETFDRLGIAHVWTTTVVDDMTFTATLSLNRERAKYIAGVDLLEVAQDRSLAGVLRWMLRQMQYLRFYVPRACAAILMVSWGAAAALAWLLVRHPVGFGLYVVAGPIAAHGVFALGKSCPHWLRELAAVALYLPLMIIGAAPVILLCLCTPFVKWKQRTYRMGMRGNVVGVERNGSPEQCVAETPAAQDVATQHPVRGIP